VLFLAGGGSGGSTVHASGREEMAKGDEILLDDYQIADLHPPPPAPCIESKPPLISSSSS